MARKPRLHVPGGFYHVMLRGNGGQDIFFAKADRKRFLELLAEGAARVGRDAATLSQAAARIERKTGQDPDFAERLAALNNASLTPSRTGGPMRPTRCTTRAAARPCG